MFAIGEILFECNFARVFTNQVVEIYENFIKQGKNNLFIYCKNQN